MLSCNSLLPPLSKQRKLRSGYVRLLPTKVLENTKYHGSGHIFLFQYLFLFHSLYLSKNQQHFHSVIISAKDNIYMNLFPKLKSLFHSSFLFYQMASSLRELSSQNILFILVFYSLSFPPSLQ